MSKDFKVRVDRNQLKQINNIIDSFKLENNVKKSRKSFKLSESTNHFIKNTVLKNNEKVVRKVNFANGISAEFTTLEGKHYVSYFNVYEDTEKKFITLPIDKTVLKESVNPLYCSYTELLNLNFDLIGLNQLWKYSKNISKSLYETVALKHLEDGVEETAEYLNDIASFKKLVLQEILGEKLSKISDNLKAAKEEGNQKKIDAIQKNYDNASKGIAKDVDDLFAYYIAILRAGNNFIKSIFEDEKTLQFLNLETLRNSLGKATEEAEFISFLKDLKQTIGTGLDNYNVVTKSDKLTFKGTTLPDAYLRVKIYDKSDRFSKRNREAISKLVDLLISELGVGERVAKTILSRYFAFYISDLNLGFKVPSPEEFLTEYNSKDGNNLRKLVDFYLIYINSNNFNANYIFVEIEDAKVKEDPELFGVRVVDKAKVDTTRSISSWNPEAKYFGNPFSNITKKRRKVTNIYNSKFKPYLRSVDNGIWFIYELKNDWSGEDSPFKDYYTSMFDIPLTAYKVGWCILRGSSSNPQSFYNNQKKSPSDVWLLKLLSPEIHPISWLIWVHDNNIPPTGDKRFEIPTIDDFDINNPNSMLYKLLLKKYIKPELDKINKSDLLKRASIFDNQNLFVNPQNPSEEFDVENEQHVINLMIQDIYSAKFTLSAYSGLSSTLTNYTKVGKYLGEVYSSTGEKGVPTGKPNKDYSRLHGGTGFLHSMDNPGQTFLSTSKLPGSTLTSYLKSGVFGAAEEQDITPSGILSAVNIFDTSVTTISIREGVKVIGESAFIDFPFLRAVRLPSTCFAIQNGAFASCPRLSVIEATDTLEYIEQGAFEYAGITDKVIIGVIRGTVEDPLRSKPLNLHTYPEKHVTLFKAGDNYKEKDKVKEVEKRIIKNTEELGTFNVTKVISGDHYTILDGILNVPKTLSATYLSDKVFRELAYKKIQYSSCGFRAPKGFVEYVYISKSTYLGDASFMGWDIGVLDLSDFENFSQSLNVFQGSKIGKIIFPKNTSKNNPFFIGNYFFSGVTFRDTTLIIPKDVYVRINNQSFYNTNLTKLLVYDNLVHVSPDAFLETKLTHVAIRSSKSIPSEVLKGIVELQGRTLQIIEAPYENIIDMYNDNIILYKLKKLALYVSSFSEKVAILKVLDNIIEGNNEAKSKTLATIIIGMLDFTLSDLATVSTVNPNVISKYIASKRTQAKQSQEEHPQEEQPQEDTVTEVKNKTKKKGGK